MTRISSPHAEPHVPGSEVAWSSPDGSRVAIVTSRGVLATDLIESRILVFDIAAIRHALAHPNSPTPQPREIAAVQSRPTAIETDAYAPVIKDVRWSRDSSTLYFRAVNLLGNYQLCTVRRDGLGFKRLTPEDRSVDRFDIEGDLLVYNRCRS